MASNKLPLFVYHDTHTNYTRNSNLLLQAIIIFYMHTKLKQVRYCWKVSKQNFQLTYIIYQIVPI